MEILKELKQYCNDIIGGKIVACQKHKWACQRFLNDLKRKDWDWYFSEEKAERYLKWMTLFRHRKGTLAGTRKIPVLYEKFVYGNIYGWVSKQDPTIRRFRVMYEQLARKQAKSQDKSIQSLYEISAFGEASAECYIAATKKEQTRHVYSEAEWMFRNSFDSSMTSKFVAKHDDATQQKVIKHVKSGGFIARLSKDDKKSGDGSNPSFAVLDEYHLHETTEYYDLMQSGAGGRKNPLLSIITTAGFDLNNPCYRVEYDLISRILNPNDPTVDDRYFAIVCELDRNETSEVITLPDGRKVEPNGIIDELGSDSAILKTNPVTGNNETVREDILYRTEQAKTSPEKYRNLLTKTYNCWIQNKESGFIDLSKWENCRVNHDNLLDIITNKAKNRVFIGVDLSSKLDLTSLCYLFPYFEDGDKQLSFAVLSHSYIPRDKFTEKINVDKVPYDLWEKQGYLTVTEGACVDYNFVIEDLLTTCRKNNYDVREICFDPWSASSTIQELQKQDNTLTIVEVGQNLKSLAEPTKLVQENIYSGRLKHDGNPLLTWAVGNCVVKVDSHNNLLLNKKLARQRIDPVSAMVTAMARGRFYSPVEEEQKDYGPVFI